MHEHGPQGGDEINVPQPGRNYGWPVITYGENYGGGKIGEGITAKAGMEQPLHYWVPSIAPSGMAFLTSDRYGAGDEGQPVHRLAEVRLPGTAGAGAAARWCANTSCWKAASACATCARARTGCCTC